MSEVDHEEFLDHLRDLREELDDMRDEVKRQTKAGGPDRALWIERSTRLGAVSQALSAVY